MGLLLNIETATEVCSVSLAREGEVIGLRESVEGQNHSVLLGVYVDELLREHGVRVEDLDAVAVSMGPGSYTGLRIGVSLAKGLCFGGDVPLVAVGTLQALAAAVADRVAEEDALYCPMIDARRMEVYTALFNRAGNAVQPVGEIRLAFDGGSHGDAGGVMDHHTPMLQQIPIPPGLFGGSCLAADGPVAVHAFIAADKGFQCGKQSHDL